MLCRIEMPTNEQIFGRFYRYRILKGTGNSRLSIIVLPVLIVVFSLFLFFTGMSPVVSGGLILLAVGYVVFTLVMKPNSIFRQKAGAALQTEVYIFTENGFTRSVRSEEGGMPDNLSAQYDILVKAVETKQDFYLFTSQTQAYLVDKEYFTKGTPEELRATLQKKLGAKFVAKK